MRQQDAEPVAAQPADQVADPDASVEPAADLDQHGIGRLAADGVVDRAHAVDADRKKRGRARRPLAGGESPVDRLAQAAAIEVAGQLVVTGEVLDPAVLNSRVGGRAARRGRAVDRWRIA